MGTKRQRTDWSGSMIPSAESLRESKYSSEGDRFFQDLLESWDNACRRDNGSVDVDIHLCDQRLRLRFSSLRLKSSLTRALRHRIVPTDPHAKSDFVIHVFDGTSGVPLPRSPWLRTDFQRRGEVNSHFTDDIVASYLIGPDILNIYHKRLKRAVYWIRNGRQIPFYEQAAPFRHLTHWLLREKGWLLVHGAGIGNRDNRGLLVIGKGGSGKSTVSIAAAIDGGMKFCGDDYCAINTSPPLRLNSVYLTAKLTEKTMEMLSLSAADAVSGDEGKRVFFIGEMMAKQAAESLDLKGFVVPGLCPAETPPGLRMMDSGEVARHLSVSSLYQMPHAGAMEFASLAEAARSLPGWLLTVPTGSPSSAVPLLKGILSDVG